MRRYASAVGFVLLLSVLWGLPDRPPQNGDEFWRGGEQILLKFFELELSLPDQSKVTVDEDHGTSSEVPLLNGPRDLELRRMEFDRLAWAMHWPGLEDQYAPTDGSRLRAKVPFSMESMVVQSEPFSSGQASVAMAINWMTGKRLTDVDIEQRYGFHLLSGELTRPVRVNKRGGS